MLVSAIMPTYNRRGMVPMALRSFQSQDLVEKELVVVDDGPDELRDLFAGVPNVTYIRLPEKKRIGAKRNLACEAARGEVIIHFDSDDWSAPGRMHDQVTLLLMSDKAVGGYYSVLFYDEAKRQASKYTGAHNYSCGTALCYRKDFWKDHRFIDSSLSEDNEFVTQAQKKEQIVSVDAQQFMVARIHPGNTSGRIPLEWPVVLLESIPAEFFVALGVQ